MVNPNKKKKATVTELALGGGLLVIFLPVVLIAVMGAIAGVGLGALYTLVNAEAFWPMLLVYGVLLAVMLWLAYKFSARFALLVRRCVGLLREPARVQSISTTLHDDTTDVCVEPYFQPDSAQHHHQT
ncbi:MAG: hypothetical protein CL610_01415 [Anaerolineaceae bacterium]|nr:hypothetical protein [Anaerolineaceae bacterium]